VTATGSFGARRRRARRLAGAFLLSLFLLANPAYACPINCFLHHHGEHADHHDGPAAMGDMCQPSGPQFTAPEAPPDRELSPNLPATVRVEMTTEEARRPADLAPAALTSLPSPLPATPPPRG
jgi:hypothetical protein